MKRLLRRRPLLLGVAAALGVVAIGGTALAGHLTSGVKSYTGCLVPKDGVIIKVKEGDAPASPCAAGMTQVHLSGGDITKISVTGALTGGGDNGEVTIGLKPEFSLPQNCDSFDFARWSGSGWACGNFSVGTGLSLSQSQPGSTTYGIAPDYRVKNTPDCDSGKFATGFDSSGAIQCASPSSSSLGGVFGATQSEPGFSDGVGIPDDGSWRTYASASLPAGSFIVLGKGTLDRDGFNDAGGEFEDEDAQKARCRLFAGSQLDMTSIDVKEDTESFDAFPFALVAPLTLSSGATVDLQCKATEADAVGIREARFLALKVG
jgi:hypothetical protein